MNSRIAEALKLKNPICPPSKASHYQAIYKLGFV